MTNKQAAIKIIKVLHRNGFEALLAGGCVRDMLLGRAAKDYDVATNAKPQQIIKLFERTLKVGAKFGVVIVLLDDKQIEVATFRAEAGYQDGRHPQAVRFTNAAEDAARRDFTINGMFYQPLEKKVIDFVGGQIDLKRKIVRTIGRPEERFAEDYLRMLRAVRFATQLDFEIEPKTLTAVCKYADEICKISGERICMELEAILTDPSRADGLWLMERAGLIKQIFPGLTAEQISLAIKVLSKLKKKTNFALALAALFIGCPTEFALERIRILKLSRNQTKHVKFLLANRGKLLDEKMSLARLKLILSEPYFRDLYELQRALQRAQNKSIGSLVKLKRRIRKLGDIELRPKPLLDGFELIKLGACPGPLLGRLAEEMYIAQLENTLRTKQQAVEWVKGWLEKHRISEG
jgi:poly(A) polymerase